jgi:hypothetical protein
MQNNTAASPDSTARSKVGSPRRTHFQACSSESGAARETAEHQPDTSSFSDGRFEFAPLPALRPRPSTPPCFHSSMLPRSLSSMFHLHHTRDSRSKFGRLFSFHPKTPVIPQIPLNSTLRKYVSFAVPTDVAFDFIYMRHAYLLYRQREKNSELLLGCGGLRLSSFPSRPSVQPLFFQIAGSFVFSEPSHIAVCGLYTFSFRNSLISHFSPWIYETTSPLR